jgi:hypothetical protein
VTYSNRLWVAVGNTATDIVRGLVVTSPDGREWSLRAISEPAYLRTVAHGNGRWVAAGLRSAGERPSDGKIFPDYGAGPVLVSSDGLSWTERADELLLPAGWHDIAYANGRWVAVGWALRLPGGPAVMVSTDTTDWTEVENVSATYPLTSVAFGSGRWIAAMSGDGYDVDGLLMVSADGTSWARVGVPPFPRNLDVWSSVKYADDKFVVVGNRVLTSPDGLHWEVVPDLPCFTGSENQSGFTRWADCAYGDGRWVAVGRDVMQSNRVYSSTGRIAIMTL